MSANRIMAILGITALAGAANAAPQEQGQQQAGHFGFQAALAGEFGGDRLVQVKFTNGDSQSVRAGQGLSLHLGAHYRFGKAPFDLGATIGYKYVTTAADNADIKLTRSVIEVLGTYFINDDWWLSAGPVMHQNIKLDLDGYAKNAKFDDATGLTFKAGWRWVGIQYTNMEYEAQAPYKGKSDASNFGIVLVGRF
jgi:hypothetical protein